MPLKNREEQKEDSNLQTRNLYTQKTLISSTKRIFKQYIKSKIGQYLPARKKRKKTPHN